MNAVREDPMTHYLLSVVQPDGPPPPQAALDKIMADVGKVLEELKQAGSWVFNGGLHLASTATVVRCKDGEVLTTDGPFAEGKEHIGGIMVLDLPDLDAALRWAGRFARAITLPIEVRPFAHVFTR
jgi:hypothetical protein